MTEALKTAINFARRGWYVFPIQPRAKFPYKDFKWKEHSTNDPEIVKRAARSTRYKDCNWALDCGKSGIFVADIDVKNDPVETVLARLPHAIETGLSVRTPSGGQHSYMLGKGPNSASKLAPNIDTRGEGGYVLIPGSVNGNGRPYEFLSQGAPAPVPAWILSALGAPAEKKARKEIPLTELDQEHNTAQAKKYLVEHAPLAVEGQGGDQTTYEIACRVRDFGISQDLTTHLMAALWNETKALPPWTAEDLEKKVANAFSYAKDRAGNASVDALFPGPLNSNEVIRCASDISLASLKPRQWLLGYRYLRGYVTLTIAPGGTGKSLLTILEGLAVASGKKLTNDDVHEKGAVWIYNTEDPFDELDRRVMAAARHHNLSKADRSDFFYSSGYDRPLKLAVQDKKGILTIAENTVNSIIWHIKDKNIKLFIVDPFVECHEVNENDNMAINSVVRIFRRIAKETNCAIGLVHHTSKSKGKAEYGNAEKARGASSLVNTVRIAHTLYNMSPGQAKNYGVKPQDCKWYVRLDDAKDNLSPPDSDIVWYQKKSVSLFFDSDETTGTLEPVQLDTVTPEDEYEILKNYVVDMVPPGENVSIYRLAAEIERAGFFKGTAKTIGKKIEEAFLTPLQLNGKTLKRSETAGKRGGKTPSVECLKELNGA